MSTRDRWLDAGTDVLVREGITAVTIDRLCTEIGLSKGSFYHHFQGVPGFREALLAHYESVGTTRYIAQAEGGGGRPAVERLRRLMDQAFDDDGSVAHERAVRVWSGHDPAAAATIARVDQRRIGYVQGLLHEITGDAAEATEMARATYLVLVGAYFVLPPVPGPEVRRLWERQLPPEVRTEAT